MEIFLIISGIIFILLAGIYWGRRSIEEDTVIGEKEPEKLNRIHL